MRKPQNLSAHSLVSISPAQQPSSPRELDALLHHKIGLYVSRTSWRELSSNVERFVREQFKEAYALAGQSKLSVEALEREIKSHVPSKTYIQDFCKGRPICYRYTNTLANFFSVKYTLGNHNPCDDWVLRIQEEPLE